MKTIFISMIGPEERVLGIFQEDGIPADMYLLFINREFKEDERVKAHKKEITEKYLVRKNYNLLETSYNDPFIIVREFNKYRIEEDLDFQQIKVILDISTFNRQNLLVMLRLLRKILNVPEIEIVYTVPKEVNPEISKGAAGFSNIPFFDGRFSIEKKKLLILLMGYEIDRPLLLWQELEPSRVILAEGVEPTAEDFYARNRSAVEEVRRFGLFEVVQISANDPYKARNQLSKIFMKKLESYNICVSPLNTKLQAVGLYLAWEENPDVQIVISFPDKFSTWLTKGIREVRRYKI